MFKKIFALFFIALLAFSALSPGPVFAETGVSDLKSNLTDFGSDTGLGAQDGSKQPELKDTIAGVINIVLGFLGIVSVIIVIIGGYKWITAGGNEEQITQAKGNIKNAVIGIGIVLAAFVIVNFAVDQLGKAATDGAGPPVSNQGKTGTGACIYVKSVNNVCEKTPVCEKDLVYGACDQRQGKVTKKFQPDDKCLPWYWKPGETCAQNGY